MTNDPIRPVNQRPETNGLGLAGFIVSLVGLCSGGILSPIGLVLSLIAVFREPRGFAIAGLVLGLLGSAFTLFLILFVGVAVVGALLAGAIAGRGSLEATFDGWILEESVAEYYDDNGAFPATIEDVPDIDSDILQDRWGRPYRITIDPDRQVLVVISDGADGQPETEDDIINEYEIERD